MLFKFVTNEVAVGDVGFPLAHAREGRGHRRRRRYQRCLSVTICLQHN